MDLLELREKIDTIDDQLVKLFEERMRVAAEVAEYKRANHIPTLDAARERQKLLSIADKLPEEFQDYAVLLYTNIFELSRSYQNKLLGTSSKLPNEIQAAIDNTPHVFPQRAAVGCQGVEGAYSQMACERLFKFPNTFFFSSFENVFSAIEQGMCTYGVIPLENSTAGSVNKVYDLMMSHNFRIVKSVRIKVDHNLLAKPGTKLSDVKEIFSHEQAINQCSKFLSTLKGVKITPCENTAMAAEFVAKSDRSDVAALSSRSCIDLYGLDCLASSCQDNGNNFTRFICITKNLEIYPGADRTSLMLVLPHRPGSLYKVLARFNALGINLIKLESRPMPSRNFEFMFYFDIESSVYSPQFMQLMAELDDICEECNYLGSYSEVI